MAIIDTLKLARALSDKGGFSINAAEATAAALNEALGEDVATKADVEQLGVTTKASIGQLETSTKASIDRLDTRLSALDTKMTMLMWAVGINVAATIAILVKHL